MRPTTSRAAPTARTRRPCSDVARPRRQISSRQVFSNRFSSIRPRQFPFGVGECTPARSLTRKISDVFALMLRCMPKCVASPDAVQRSPDDAKHRPLRRAVEPGPQRRQACGAPGSAAHHAANGGALRSIRGTSPALPPSHRPYLEHFAVVTGLKGNPKLAAAVEFCHHRHHCHHGLASAVVDRRLYVRLLAEPDQVTGGWKRQFEPSAPAAFERFARRYPDRIGGFLAVVGAGLLRRRGGEKEPGIEPFWHALRRDPMRIRHQLVERQQHSVIGEHFQESGLALAQGGAVGGFDLAGALCIDQRLRSAWTRQQDAALLKGFTDRRDPETQGGGIEAFSAGIKLWPRDDLLIALVDAATGKHQRARVKVDFIMAHHHEDLDLAFAIYPGAVAQQQDGGRGTWSNSFGRHIDLLPR